jgi:hypothetical protein
MSSHASNLDSALKSLPMPSKLPMAMPPAHLSIARWFEAIVNNGELEPRTCKVFGKDILYLFYGGVFYRTKDNPTRNASELPIAFLFQPSVLNDFDCYYPLDTGAMATGLYGDWKNRFDPFEERLRINGGDYSIPSQIVHHIYGSNENYLIGELDSSLSTKLEPFPQLGAFLSDDLSSRGVDSRQNRIECHKFRPLALGRDLLWVGFPESHADIFARLYERTKPLVPECFPYASHKIIRPNEVAAMLEFKAREVINRYVSLPKGRASL